MARDLIFLHTSSEHIATFSRLVEAIDPTLQVRHRVDESWLHEAQSAGKVTPALAQKVTNVILAELSSSGGVILCTCSTIGPIAEQVNQVVPASVVRVDRPMAEKAVALGSRIVIMATLATTFFPTRELIVDAAKQANKSVEIIEIFCQTAWAKFEQGDKAGYLQEIAKQIEAVEALGDVIMLAQASMAEAATLCKQMAVPVLSSPQLGVEAAIKLAKLQI